MNPSDDAPSDAQPNRLTRLLAAVERIGNRLPDPAMLFVGLLILVWLFSWLLSGFSFELIDPRNGEAVRVYNQLSGEAMARFMAEMVPVFIGFHPIGVVLVAMLGIGVAEHTGFLSAALRGLLSITARWLLTPVLIFVGVISATAADAGYVLVIPLGGVLFYAAGRHPLAGIAAAFAGVSGGFSANIVPSSLDPMLSAISQAGGQLIDPTLAVNPLNNYFFTTLSSVLIVGLGWWVTDRIVEPRLRAKAIDGAPEELPGMQVLTQRENRALAGALLTMVLGLLLLAVTMWPSASAWRGADGALTESGAPLMSAIVPLIFLLFLLPGITYGLMSGSVRSSRDVIAGMTASMNSMAYYLVIMFFIAQFVAAFASSNLGVLMALAGASALEAAGTPAGVTIVGLILLTGLLNIFLGSASAKWALIAPILVPMLMQVGISPDLTQAAYRIGDSATNIITPLMPYFPLIVVYCQRYVRDTGIGTLTAMMLPYSVVFLVAWTAFLLIYWALGIPLGLQASYTYP
jgi:aminobenzoyl-glutamate transport protein